MPLINTSVPNLIQGVSQQPDATRHAGQCEEQENALSSVVDGLKKRPNTRHIARLLTTAIAEDSFVHFINRSDSERYVIIHDGTNLYAYNILTGDEATINGSTGGYDVSGTPYIDTTSPRQNLKALSIADSTLLLNTTTGVAAKTSKTDALEKKALVFIKQGDYKKKYSVSITGGIVGGTGASITLSIQKYLHSGGGRGNYYGVPIYRWRVTGVSAVADGGSNYSGNLTVTVSSNRAVYTQPQINFNVSNGVIQSSGHTIVNQGDFAGVDTTSTGLRGSTTTYYGDDPPTLTVAITDANPSTASSPSTASITSEGSSDAAHADTDRILERLVSNSAEAADLNDTFNTAYHIKKNANTNLVEIKKKTTTDDFTISSSDGLGGGGIGVVYKEVSSISDLPTIAPEGFVVKVRGDTELAEDDYYVKFETKNGQTTTSQFTSTVGEGSWIETVAPEITKGIDASTMPHTLKNDAVNSFIIEETSFTDRVAGDDNSNPLPSFIGQSIDNLFFFKSRLGFLSNENIIMSESGLGGINDAGNLSYNLMRTTVTTLLDSDPIDVAVASSRVTNLKSAKGFQENLVLFSANGQFVLKGGDVLTPKTVSVTPITNFSFEDQVEPLPLGSYIYFPFTRGTYTGLREFTLNASTDVYDSVEVTEHVPAYIPHNIIDMAGTTTEDTIALLSGDETDALYIYHYFWNNNQKVLSSWSKFTFDDDIRGIEFIDSTLYMVTVDDHSNTHLLELPLEADAAEVDHNGNAAAFRTLVDKRVRARMTQGSTLIEFEQPDGTYSSAHADLPYTYYNANLPTGGVLIPETFVDSDGNEYDLKYQNIGSGGQVLRTDATPTPTLYGYVGLPYTMKYKFSTQIFKASSGNSASPTAASSMQVRNGVLFFDDTHTFDVKVTPDGRPEVTETFSADDRPEAETLGNRKFAEGNFRFPVHSKAKNVEIVVENDSPFDSKFSSAEFESFVHPRSRRYG